MTAIQLPKDRLISMAELTGATAAIVQPDANVYTVTDPQLPYVKGSHSFQKAVMGMHRVALVNAIEAGTVTARSLSTRVPFRGHERIDSDWERTSNAYGVTHADALKFCELLAIDVNRAEPGPAPEPLEASAPVGGKPVQRRAAQEFIILETIRTLGFDPEALPKNPPGKSGPKSDVRTRLIDHKLFVGKTTFDKAWDGLRKNGDIADAT